MHLNCALKLSDEVGPLQTSGDAHEQERGATMKRLFFSAVLLVAFGGLAAETSGQDLSGPAGQSAGDTAEGPATGAERLGCSGWKTVKFFISAAPEDIAACLAAGSDPNAKNFRGWTPLHEAASGNENAAVTQALIAAGADPNAKDDSGLTTLHMAAKNENGSVARILIVAGVDADARTSRGQTPLHWARHPNNAKMLLAAGANIRRRDENGRTPLHTLAETNQRQRELVGVLDVLVGAGADVMARDAFGQTPLHRIGVGDIYVSPLPMIQALMAHGADINAQDHDGNTPLHLAAASTAFGDDSAVMALLDAGADTTRQNAQMQTPWDIAMTNEKLKRFDAYRRLNEMRFPVDAPAEAP